MDDRDQSRRYVFGATRFDPAAHDLVHDGLAVRAEPGTLALLSYLIEHRHRVVPKEELLDEIWGDRFVSESALTTRVKHARSAVGDDGQRQAVIKTVHGVGYRFVADVAIEIDPPRHMAGARVIDPVVTWDLPNRKRLIGRDRTVEELADRIRSSRLVTITGPAGVGKSALARALFEVADERDTWFCEWGDARSAKAAASVVLDALGATQRADTEAAESLARLLETRTDLLIFDNCEHVLIAASELVAMLIDRCPGIRVLATSRVPLGVRDESVLALEPLGVDDAVQCFVERARNTGAAVRSDDPAVRDLCRHLDGLPLALELAAARSRTIAPVEMIELIQDRFRLLRTTDDVPLVSLHDSIASSWDALDGKQQQLLSCLGVLVGAFDVKCVRGLAMPDDTLFDVIDVMEQLVRRSMVVALPGPDGRTRFRLLESIRDFALERLEEVEAARAAHVSYFVERAEELDLACQTTHIDDAFVAFAEIWVNVRAAVGYARADSDVSSVRRILVAVAEYAEMHSIYELLEWCDAAGLDDDITDATGDGLAADATAVKARMLAHRCAPLRAYPLAQQAIARHESRTTLQAIVWCAYYLGDMPTVLAHTDRLLTYARSLRGLDRAFADGFDAATRAGSGEAVHPDGTIDPSMATTGVLGLLDVVTEGHRRCVAEPLVAAELLEAAFAAAASDDRDLILSSAGTALNIVVGPARPVAVAVDTLARTLSEYRKRGLLAAISSDLVVAAGILGQAGQADLAARLIGARRASGYALGPSEVLVPAVTVELKRALGAEHDTITAQGAQWPLIEAARVAHDALCSLDVY